MMKSAFHIYLAISFALGTTLLSFVSEALPNSGLYVQVCGTGQTVFIAFGEDTPPTPEHNNIACHVICSGRSSDDGDESCH